MSKIIEFIFEKILPLILLLLGIICLLIAYSTYSLQLPLVDKLVITLPGIIFILAAISSYLEGGEI